MPYFKMEDYELYSDFSILGSPRANASIQRDTCICSLYGRLLISYLVTELFQFS